MTEPNHSRRTVLRGLLASISALCLPRLSWAATGKMTQAQAEYRDQPNGEQRCDNCHHFIQPNACTIVEGNIRPEGWCKFWMSGGPH